MIRFIIFTFLVAIGLKGFCQSQGVVVTSNSPGKIIPGGHFTLFFDVKSDLFLPDSLHETIGLPEKWNLLSQRRPEIAPGQKVRRYIFVISIPAESTAGNYIVNFNINAGQGQFTTTLSLTVDEVRKVDIIVTSRPEFIKEGDTLRVEYMVQNFGNKKEKLLLKTNRGFIENVRDSITLDPNTKMKVTVAQVIPFTEGNAWQSASDLTAAMTGGAIPAYQVTAVPVFSSKIKKIDPYYRFPVEIGGGYLSYMYGNQSNIAYQYSALGKGFIDQKEKHYIDFTVRGPNQFVFPAVGSYDQYSLDYAYNKKTFVSVGDYVMQLNNLMEFGRFGRGLRLEQQFKGSVIRCFIRNPGFIPIRKKQPEGKSSSG